MVRALLLSSVFVAGAVAAEAQTAREVTYTPRAVVPVHAKLRFTTMIILPAGEEILDFVCGDKDFWVVSGAQNLAYVKPAKAGAQTNLNLVTASGQVYAFLLTEGAADHDLTVYVVPERSPGTPADAEPRFYSAAQVNELRAAAEQATHHARDATVAAAKAIDEGISAFRASYPMQLQFPYRFKAHTAPFQVSAIFHDGRFTYIRSAASELPALYEIRDGSPNLVPFQVEHGTYIVPKVLERGYLAIGKQKWVFATAGR
jgi:type IV secretion system protein VirB9